MHALIDSLSLSLTHTHTGFVYTAAGAIAVALGELSVPPAIFGFIHFFLLYTIAFCVVPVCASRVIARV
jgi:type III secretory pathway component EscV